MTSSVSDVLHSCKSNPKALELFSINETPEHEMRKKLESGFRLYRGKVRDLFIKDQAVHIFHSDRLSAFDRSICDVPQRGIILAAMTEFWMKKAQEIIPTQQFERCAPRWIMAEKAEPLKVEVVVRGYLAGSMLRAYKTGARQFCGHPLPDGLKDYQRLAQAIITPTTKASVYQHDEDITPREIVEQGLCTDTEWQTVCERALQLFALGQQIYHRAGWILADTKYEFGRRANGEIILIDECHTPDSSRLWRRDDSAGIKMFDKEIIRSYLADQGFTGEGDVPHIPTELIIELGESYLAVAQSLIDETI